MTQQVLKSPKVEFAPLSEFRLAAQEIVGLRSSARMQWVEFLLRPGHSSASLRSALTVQDYIRAAYKRHGNEFDHRVIESAFREARYLPESARFSVNVLPSSLHRPDLLRVIRRASGESGVATDRLILEVIEYGGALAIESCFDTVSALRTAGVSFALDDYGQGFSNLGLVSAGMVDFIKLDRSIVQGGQHSPHRDAVISGLQAFADSTGVSLVAEGIETEQQVRRMEQHGIPWVQGFLYSRPTFLERGTEHAAS